MKKTRNLILILFVGLLTLVSATSCAMLSGSDDNETIEPSGPVIIEAEDLGDLIGYNSFSYTIYQGWPPFGDKTYWVISYDPKLLRLNSNKVLDLPIALRVQLPVEDNRTYVMISSSVESGFPYDTCYIEPDFTIIPQREEISSAITFYFVVQSAYDDDSYSIEALTNDIQFTIHPNTTEDLAAPSGRLYGFTYGETISNEAYNIDTRAIVPGTRQKISTSYSSLNATSRKYSAFISVVGEYASHADAFFREDNKGNRTYFYDYNSSSSSNSLPFYIDVNSSIVNSEAFAAGEDLQVEILIADMEGYVVYKGVVSYPITVFDDSMCEISGITASSTGVGGQALSGTRVYIDAVVDAFSTDDCFRYAKVMVTDPSTGKVVLNSRESMNNVGRSTVGTIANGWGATDLFARNTFSFVPEKAGNYYVEVIGYDSDGYNICYASSTILVI